MSEACSIAHQPAGFCIVAKRIGRGQSAEHRQERQLDTPVVKERGALDEEAVGSFANKACEGRLDLAAAAGIVHLNLQPDGAGGRFASRNVVSVTAASAGLTSTAIRVAPGTSWRRSSNRFAANSVARKLIPVRLPPGRARLVTRPSLTGSSETAKTTGMVVVAALAEKVGGIPPAAITA